MFSTILEIMRTRHYTMEPVAFSQARQLVLHNILTHTPSGVERETLIGGALRVADGKAAPLCGQLFVGNAQRVERMAELNADDQIVNLIRLTGTMMRCGDDCSYGSMELRDMLMQAADDPHVVAHVIYTHTPGGAADTLRDFRKAINYCHQKGQKVYMYIDGGAASGGAFLACMTDGVYAFNEKDEIGSLGMYCAFFTNKNGDEDAISKETYREFYCDRSTDKNLYYRAAADGDLSVIAEECNAYLDELLANAKKDRPAVKDEQLTGKMYPIGTVVGSLVDGVCTLEELALLATDEYNKRAGAALPAKEEATAPAKKNPKNKTDMKELTQLAAAVGAEELAHDEQNGIYLNEEQAVRVEDTLAAHAETTTALAEERAAAASVQAALVAANARIAELEAAAEEATQNSTAQAEEQARLNGRIEELEAAAATVEEEHAAALAAATAATETAVQTAREEMQAALTEAQTALTEANAHAAEQEQTIIDLRSQVAELENSPRRMAQPAPKGNGSNPAVAASKKAFIYDPTKSATENAKALEAHNVGLKQMAQ